MEFNFKFGYLFLQKSIELIRDLIERYEYSTFGCSNNLFLF